MSAGEKRCAIRISRYRAGPVIVIGLLIATASLVMALGIIAIG